MTTIRLTSAGMRRRANPIHLISIAAMVLMTAAAVTPFLGMIADSAVRSLPL